MEQIVNALRDRIAALESANENSEPDYSEPPLYFEKADGTPVDPDSIENVPSLASALKTFDGDLNELSQWLKNAETVFNIFNRDLTSYEKRNRLHLVCMTIRNKIIGKANDVLVTYRTNNNFHLIKKTLLHHYSDKRDLQTLDYLLMNCEQRGRPIDEYYNQVNKLLSLIANHITTNPKYQHPEAMKVMLETYTNKAIEAFTRGLDGDDGRFLRNSHPTSLAEAYSYCISSYNMEFRKSSVKIENKHRYQAPPPPPPRNNKFRTQHPITPRYNTTYVQNPVPIRQNLINNHPRNLSANPPRPQPAIPNHFNTPNFDEKNVEPMDVDQSIRSRQINYMNRPAPSGNTVQPVKKQRVFNIETSDPKPGCSYHQEKDDKIQYPSEEEIFEEYLHEYNKYQDEEDSDDDLAEFHFLG